MTSDEAEKTKGRKRIQKSYFDVLGICCSSEVPLVESILRPLEGVKDVTVIIATRTVIVLHDTVLISQPQIAKALNEARLEANVRNRGEHVEFKNKWPSPYSVTCGALLLLSFLKYVYRPLGWLALGAVAVGIIPIGFKAVASIRNLRLDINILALIAVIGTVAMADYLEAGTIVFLFTIAEWLESRASQKANVVMTSLMSMVPQKAVIAETGELVDADEVKLNTIVAVKAGEVIPIDGVVVEGSCEVDEKTLTGESFPVAKHNDSTVWAGTINLNGYISVKTTALAEDCAVAKMAMLVEEAQNSKTKTQRLIDQCAKFYTPGVLIISILVAVIPAALRLGNLKKWFHLALVVLVSACPCGLILSTPVATFCALTKAAKSGLLVKGGDYLEALAKIKTLALDKTGTITRGEFIVTEFKALTDKISLDDLLYWVSSIESKSSHPMASALVSYAKSVSSMELKPDNVEDYQNFPGEGIYGRIDDQDVYVGNKKISARASSGTVPSLEGEVKDGRSVGYIYCGGILVGMFSLSDACRSGVAEAIKELKSLGIKTAMLTGDSRQAAMYTNQQIGLAIDAVHAELLPEDKARLITEFKKDGAVGMVGDGINDAPALATADVGISMGISGSALATQTGHVILMSNDIRNIPKVIKISRQAKWKVIQNIALSIVTKLAIIALALAGHPLVWAAVLADVGTCVVVILNSMLLLREPHHHAKCRKSIASSDHVHVHGHKCSTRPTKPSPHKAGHHCCTKEKPQQLSTCCGDEKRHVSVTRHDHDHDHDHKHHNLNGHGSSAEKLCCPTEKPRISPETRASKPQTSTPCCGDHKPHNLPESHDHGHDHNHDQDHHNHHGHDHHHDHSSSLGVGSQKKESSTMTQRGWSCCQEEPISFTHKYCASETRVSKTRSASPCCNEEPKSLAQNHNQAMPDDKDRSTIDVVIQAETIMKNDDSEIRQLIEPDNGCLALERREMGDCCKSYLKECCGSKHCLTEVVIDH